MTVRAKGNKRYYGKILNGLSVLYQRIFRASFRPVRCDCNHLHLIQIPALRKIVKNLLSVFSFNAGKYVNPKIETYHKISYRSMFLKVNFRAFLFEL